MRKDRRTGNLSDREIKLIACDLDGTLRPSECTEIPEYNVKAVNRAKSAGLLFCPATGRTRHSCLGLLGELMNGSYCIAENGGTVYSPEAAAVITHEFDPDTAEEICRHILSVRENELMMTGEDTVFVRASAVEFERMLREEIYEKTGFAESASQLSVPLVKISAFCPDSSVMYPILSPGWKKRCNVTIAGDLWVDFTVADKGTGVADLCAYLGISPENVMAIGDNYNDIPMLDIAGCPVIMDSAPEELKKRYPYCFRTVAQAIDALLLSADF